ncbi:hypothetical protein LCGC14_1411090 [marine sediment metagenome]|uniref:Uncharacterized protein n=1 Tax=marine sediment metagenome TaxID=412755 RepID=A0A0F9KFB0_9ZZZZ
MKIEIGKWDGVYEARVECLADGQSVTHHSTHETAYDAAREAEAVLRAWSTTEGECPELERLWLVIGESDKLDDLVYVVPAATRLGAVANVARMLVLPWSTSHGDSDDLRIIINARSEYPVKDGWETPRWFWDVGCAPFKVGSDMQIDGTWDWEQDEVEEKVEAPKDVLGPVGKLAVEVVVERGQEKTFTHYASHITNSVSIKSGATRWELGGFVEMTEANKFGSIFTIRHVYVESVEVADIYELVIYQGDDDVECARLRFVAQYKTEVPTEFNAQTRNIQPDDKLRARLACLKGRGGAVISLQCYEFTRTEERRS